LKAGKGVKKMRHVSLGMLGLVVTMLGLLIEVATPAIGSEADNKLLSLMTFNIRADEGLPRELGWDVRGELVARIFRTYEPDVVGIQEGLKHQVDYLITRLPDYVMVGEGLRGGTEREHNALFYKRNQFYLREAGSFWLKPIPDIVTWARLAFISDGREFVVMNTHLHQYQRPDDPTAWYMLLDKAREFAEKYEVPVFLMGDMNEEKGVSAGWRILCIGEGIQFRDSWLYARARIGPVVSFDFRESVDTPCDPSLWYKRIDWILFMGDVTPLSIVTIMDKINEAYYVSDHRPVLVKFAFEPVTYTPPELAPPALSYGKLELSSTEDIQAGDEVTVRVQVKNRGGLGSVEIPLVVDGEVVERREMFLLPGAVVKLEFTVSLFVTGEHSITVGELPPRQVVVKPAAPPF